MHIEVQPQQDMSVLLIGYPTLQALTLAYLLSKSGIQATFFSDGTTEAGAERKLSQSYLRESEQGHSIKLNHGHSSELEQPNTGKLRLSVAPSYTQNFERCLTQGRWQWVHICAPNSSLGKNERINQIARTSRKLGLYISLNIAAQGSNHSMLPQGILELLPLATYLACLESDARRLFSSVDSTDVEFRLRKLGFRGVGITIRRQSDSLYRVEKNHATPLTFSGNLAGEAKWLIQLIHHHESHPGAGPVPSER